MHTIYSRGIIELHYLCSCLRIQKRIYISTQSLYQVLKLLYIFKISRWCELTQHIIYVKGSILEGPDAIVEAKVPVIRTTHNDLIGTIIITCIIGVMGTIFLTPYGLEFVLLNPLYQPQFAMLSVSIEAAERIIMSPLAKVRAIIIITTS